MDSNQFTLKRAIGCTGVGVHTGEKVQMQLLPAEAHSGIVFIRSDLKHNNEIKAKFDNVVDTKLCTILANDAGVRINTVEHLMAALWGSGVDNVIVKVNGPEIPIMDGSSSSFIELIDQAGLRSQGSKRQVLKILKPITIEQDGKEITLLPGEDFSVDFSIDFADKVIGKQRFEFGDGQKFDSAISKARTFGFMNELKKLRSLGLAKGASLENAIAIEDGNVLNPNGLIYENEFVRHKILDCIGDLYLAGCRIKGKVVAKKAGHALNNAVLKSLFEQPESYRYC